MASGRLLCLGTYSTGRLLRDFRCITFLQRRTAYRKRGGHDVMRENEFGRSREERLRLVDTAEEAEDLFNEETWRYVKNRQREEETHRESVKFKIIEKKYFRPPQETNLLTWDAKEQIRYLHQEFPEEWTVDRLAESFPTSREGVIKILKSSWRPFTLVEVLRHDRAVRKRWLALSSNEKEAIGGGGPLEERYQKLLEGGNLRNAAGITALPSPETGPFLPQPENITDIVTSIIPLQDNRHPLDPKRKKFVDIVAGRLCQNGENRPKQGNNEIRDNELEDHRRQNIDVLAEVIEGLPGRKLQNRTAVKLESALRQSQGQKQYGFRNVDRKQEQTEYRLNHLLRGSGKDKRGSMLDCYDDEDATYHRGDGDVGEKLFLAQAEATLKGEMEIPAAGDFMETSDNRAGVPGSHRYNDQIEFKSGQSPPMMESPRLASRRTRRLSNRPEISEPVGEDFDDPLNIPAAPRRTLRRRRVGDVESKMNREPGLSMSEYERLQMEGTGKISPRARGDDPSQPEYGDKEDVIPGLSGRLDKFSKDEEKEKIFQALRYDVPSQRGGEWEEAYLYSQDSGYQHPLGKVDPGLKIDVPHEHKGESRRRYQRGSAVYDENGDLLFRVPE